MGATREFPRKIEFGQFGAISESVWLVQWGREVPAQGSVELGSGLVGAVTLSGSASGLCLSFIVDWFDYVSGLGFPHSPH